MNSTRVTLFVPGTNMQCNSCTQLLLIVTTESCIVEKPPLLGLLCTGPGTEYCKGSQTFQAVTPEIIIFEVGTPLYLFDSIPQINIVKIADLKSSQQHSELSDWLFSQSFFLDV